MGRRNIKRTATLLHIGLAIALSLVFAWQTGLNPLWGWLPAINLIAFAAMAKDKMAAQSSRTRTPEITFHIMGFLGGFPGVYMARRTFRHKTRDEKFTFFMWASFILQGVAIVYFLYLSNSY